MRLQRNYNKCIALRLENVELLKKRNMVEENYTYVEYLKTRNKTNHFIRVYYVRITLYICVFNTKIFIADI